MGEAYDLKILKKLHALYFQELTLLKRIAKPKVSPKVFI